MANGCSLREVAHRCGYRVGEICAVLQCSERYFRRVFLRDTGLSPKQWLREERMAVALQELEKGSEPGVIAEALGFASPSAFRREFRNLRGFPLGTGL